jgi:hypothetical protein
MAALVAIAPGNAQRKGDLAWFEGGSRVYEAKRSGDRFTCVARLTVTFMAVCLLARS